MPAEGESAHAAGACAGMLQGMQQPASPASSSASPTFAGLLAALSARPSGAKRATAWNDDGLAEDVATLSYERALRAHARYRAPEASDRALTQPAHAGIAGKNEAIPTEAGQTSAAVAADPEPEVAPAADDRNLKCASITIRLSKAECERLRKRAAEAGLTVSAYMRSCTFEAEQLRELVKGTLAQLRTEPVKASTDDAAGDRHGWRQWLGWLRPHGHAGHPVDQG